jgi:Cu(I)/Ag(I) efflux system membrane fusion protein
MKILILLFTFFLSLHAKIIEVDQLFNKAYANVSEKSISFNKTFYAKTMLDESKIVDINTRFNGFIEKLYANKSYMYVDKNKPLLSVYSDEVASAIQELWLAKRLNKNNAIYKSAYNKLISFGLHENTLSKILNDTKEYVNVDIYSPISGYIVQKSVNEKSFIKEGTLLFQVADFSKLWVIAKIYQQDIDFISEGMSAKVSIDGKEEMIEGAVDYIYPNINEKDQSIDVRIVIDNTKLNLYPNMFAKVNLYKPTQKMLTLPRSAVLTKGQKHYVFKPISDREFEPVLIEAKRIDAQTFQILEGLEVGERVIDKVMFMLDSDAITNGLYESDEEW